MGSRPWRQNPRGLRCSEQDSGPATKPLKVLEGLEAGGLLSAALESGVLLEACLSLPCAAGPGGTGAQGEAFSR